MGFTRAVTDRGRGTQRGLTGLTAQPVCAPLPSRARRTYSWLQRLRIDIERCAQAGFQFVNNAEGRTEKLKLEGIGPRMLVSRETTGTAPFLRWRLEVRGNNAMELGVVPESLQVGLAQRTLQPQQHAPRSADSLA